MTTHGTSAEALCCNLIALSAYYADTHDAEAMAGLFLEDGAIDRPGGEITGRTAILAFARARPRSRITRHLLSAPAILIQSPGTVRAVTSFQLYEGVAATDPGGAPLTLKPPSAVGDWTDELRLTESGWKIARRQIGLIFAEAA